MTVTDQPKTPLGCEIAAMIGQDGPMSIGHYMTLCLGHPKYGYYMTRDPFGSAGDFTTAPEISQMFGELIGLWAADTWSRLGAPEPLNLVELGPGRGTLMADALRACSIVPSFRSALCVHLVETSPVLRDIQRRTLSATGVPITWHQDFARVPAGPLVVIANEFFDALPVFQFERIGRHWHERLVGLGENDGLVIAVGAALTHIAAGDVRFPDAPPGSITEWAPARERIAAEIAGRLLAAPGAALVIDYGHRCSGLGDTLQALCRHEPVGILDRPGQCDLTSHVDFQSLVRAATSAGGRCFGPIDMGRFLADLGIAERARRLCERANSKQRSEIAAALARLTKPDAMGSLFKALAIASPDGAPPVPFDATSCPT